MPDQQGAGQRLPLLEALFEIVALGVMELGAGRGSY
jgi:hypothetical protein